MKNLPFEIKFAQIAKWLLEEQECRVESLKADHDLIRVTYVQHLQVQAGQFVC